MSRCSWRSAEVLQARRREQQAFERKRRMSRARYAEELREWRGTGCHAFLPRERHYPNGGGVDGVAGFLVSVERALHLHDRRGGGDAIIAVGEN